MLNSERFCQWAQPKLLKSWHCWALGHWVLKFPASSQIWYSFICRATSGRSSERLYWKPPNSTKCNFLSLEEVVLGSQYHPLSPSHVCCEVSVFMKLYLSFWVFYPMLTDTDLVYMSFFICFEGINRSYTAEHLNKQISHCTQLWSLF